ncbi:GNAT family N-acetyltransferase [Alkalimonas delamerensis]|uniref:GNAT family N-acetyltransferase n=1 Tax=Alkalimonas delamerensis TaxID=265981 RepID=A0ABT9GNJ9_9GAMM|nr:GNAT family N-acetyltransferase [Alkalimonas delamerensis]MDP4528545.1 GNAT family N-acetyltransferase [Alkalimonas delamerensis]
MQSRLLVPSDHAFYAELYSDHAIMRHIGTPLTAELAERSFRQALKHNAATDWQRLFYVIEDKARFRLGLLGFTQDADDETAIELGILLCKEAQGKGLSTSTIKAGIEKVFETSIFQKVRLEVHRENMAAVAMAQSIARKFYSEQTINNNQFCFNYQPLTSD